MIHCDSLASDRGRHSIHLRKQPQPPAPFRRLVWPEKQKRTNPSNQHHRDVKVCNGRYSLVDYCWRGANGKGITWLAVKHGKFPNCFLMFLSALGKKWKLKRSKQYRKSEVSRQYPCILPLQSYNFNQAFRFRRGALDMASPRQRPKRIIKDGIKATTHQQAGSCNNVNNTIKTSDIFLGGQCAGQQGPTDNCLQEGKAMGTHDTSWYHAGEMGLQKDVSFVKSSFSRLAFKQKLYKRGMILMITIGMKHVWNNCRHMKKNMCSRIAMRPLMRSTSSLGTKSYSFVSPIEGRCSLTVTLKHRGNKLHVTDSFTFTSFTSFTSWHVQCSLNTLHYRRLQHLCSPAMSQGACYRMSCGAFVKNWRILQLLHPWRIAFYRIWNQIQTSWIQNGLPFVLALLFLNRRPAGLVVSKCFMKDKNSSKT